MEREYRYLPFPPPSPLPMMNVLMAEIIYSWFSFGLLRDLQGQPVQLLQFTNEKTETNEVK